MKCPYCGEEHTPNMCMKRYVDNKVAEHGKRLAEIENRIGKIDTHEKLISEGTVDAVVFENNMLKSENAELRKQISDIRDTNGRVTISLQESIREIDKYKRYSTTYRKWLKEFGGAVNRREPYDLKWLLEQWRLIEERLSTNTNG